MPFFIRQYNTSVKTAVHIIEAQDEGAAYDKILTPGDESCQGYYNSGIPPAERNHRCFGPFASKEEAESSQEAWVEDAW